MDTDARPIRDGDRSIFGHLDFRIDYIRGEVAPACGHVTRQREIRQGREVDIVGTADAAFQHATVPDGNGVSCGQIVDLDGLGVPADPPWLDVDHPAGSELDGFRGAADGVQRLIQADRRAEAGLQPGMVADVVVVQRLFDHHEIVSVECLQMFCIGQMVGAVGVDHEGHVAEPRPDQVDRLNVPPRFDFDLDAPVAGSPLDLHALDELIERILNAYRNTGFDRRPDTSEHTPQRCVVLLRKEIPGCHLDGGLGHVVSANSLQRSIDVARMRELAAEHERSDEVVDDVPRRACRFGAVVRIFIGDALGEASAPLLLDRDEDEGTLMNTAKAGLEEANERKTKQTQLDPLDTHGTMLTQEAALYCGVIPDPPKAGAKVEARAAQLQTLQFRYITIEGPAGVGKSVLADRLGARLDAMVVLDEKENPFIADFHAGRPGAGFQTQLFFTLARHRQLTSLRQTDLFSQMTVCDYLFDRDKIYAYLNLDDNELYIYERLYALLAPDTPTPDLVIYLQSPTDVLRRRLRDRAKARPELPTLDDDYVRELNEAYNHFFFHYTATPLLVIETSQLDLTWGDEAVADLERQLRSMGKGTRYYVPRT